jgi:phosphatidate cytidylyltransferase
MLRQRVITALVLVGLLLGALVSERAWPFALLMLALVAAAGWEWARLNGAAAAVAAAVSAALVLAGAGTLASGGVMRVSAATWWGAALLWLVAGGWALRRGPAAWPRVPRPLVWALGLLALGVAWLALAQARSLGVNFLLSLLCLVWMADIAAYFGGRAWGVRKLAPSISPGKSWAGVWSGMAGVLLLGLCWVWVDSRLAMDSASLYTRLWRGLGAPGAALALLALCAMSVLGDLIESLVKRAAGAKDSGRLLPGHGGVLDRVDALLPVLPAALALLWLVERR